MSGVDSAFVGPWAADHVVGADHFESRLRMVVGLFLSKINRASIASFGVASGALSSILVLLAMLAPSVATARQFDFKSAGFGTYVRGEYGLATRGDASFADSSGANVSFSGSRSTTAGGEFGFLFAGEKSTFRLSAEVLLPKRLAGLEGTSSGGGVKYFDLDSKVTVITPQANLDFVVQPFAESRILASVGGGLALATTQNVYKMTSAGTAAFGGVTDHTETGKGQGIDAHASAIYEIMFADHATLAFDIGYRYCKISALTSSDDVHTFTGTYKAGDKLKNNDGSDRSIDLSGLFAGAGFRFYF